MLGMNPMRIFNFAPLVLIAVTTTIVGCGGDTTQPSAAAPSGQVATQPTSQVTIPSGPPVITTPWASIGPSPPAIEAPIAVHRPTGTMYVASLGGGVAKRSFSTPGGFSNANTGLANLQVNSMVMAANDPSTLYVGTFGGGISKTTDSGANWAPTGDATNVPLVLAIDPNNANTVFAGYNAAFSIRKTTDGGTTWLNANAGVPANTVIFAIALDPLDARTVYAGSVGNGAFKSTDGGATWSALSADSTIYSFWIDPQDNNTIFAGSGGNGVFRSNDGGARFVRVGVPGDGVIIALAKSQNYLFAATGSRGIWFSRDDGVTWMPSSLTTGLFLSLTVDSAGIVYAGSGSRGAFYSYGDEDFLPLDVPPVSACNCQNGHAIVVDPSDSLHVVFSTNDSGLSTTRNGGSDWSGDASGMVSRSPRSIAFDPRDPQRVYAGSFIGGGLFKSTDGGRTWQRRVFGPSNLHVTGVAVDPTDGTVYLSALQGGGLWKSTDFGETFARIDVATIGGPFLNLGGRGIAVDSSSPNKVFFAGGNGVWRSLDRGATWSRVSTVSAQTVIVDPTNSQVVYAGSLANGVLKSTDGGAAFREINIGLTELRTGRTGGVQLHRSEPQTLYVNTEGGGVFKSTDAGGTWFAINSSLPERTIFGLAIDPNNPRILYASTPRSVYKTVSGGE